MAKKCPLRQFHPCVEEKCAWFVESPAGNGECVIVDIATELADISELLNKKQK